MTQTTFIDNVEIEGSQDIEQLRVLGHTSQEQPLQTWENSAGDVLAQVTGDGRLIVGDDDGTPNSLIEAHQLNASLTKPNRGFHSLGQVNGSLSALLQWIVGELELTGSENIDALHTALRIRASNLNTGTPTSSAELRGADIEVINDDDASANPLTKVTGLQVSVTNESGRTITDAIGLKVKMNNDGTITNPFSIFTEGDGPVHFEDYIELQNLDDVFGTPPTGFLWVYPKSDGKLYAKNSSGTEFDLTGGGSGAVTSVNSQTGDVVLDTDDVAEGTTNKYYTAARFDTALASKDTDDITEGSNLYFTNARADGRISAQKGAANGLATLGSDSKVPASQLPAIAITDVFVVSSEAAMLALTAERGDIAVRTDLDKSFILVNETPGTLSNWQEILAPGLSTVLSVNSQTGAVVLDTDDIAEGSTNQYYTHERVDDRVAVLLTAGANINISYDDAGNALTVSVTGLTASDISDFSEAVDDRVHDLFAAGSNIALTYDDVGNTFTISFTGTLATTVLTGVLQAAQFPALTGDVTTSSGSLATTLATVNSNVGSFAAADITVNAKGLITAAAAAASSGSGNIVRASSPTLTSPVINTPAISGGTMDNTSIGATTANSAIFNALSLLIGGFKAIFSHSNAADRTYTLPDYNGTLATLSGSEVLTNKTIGVSQLSGQVSTAKGGTGQDFSASSGIVSIASGNSSLLASTGSGDVVRKSSPTIQAPVIADFSAAIHTHLTGAGGGTLDASAIASGVLALAQGGLGISGSSVPANKVFVSPNGSSGGAGFRSLVDADLPTALGAHTYTGLQDMSGASLKTPTSGTPSADGQVVWNSSKMLQIYDGTQVKPVTPIGWQPYAMPIGWNTGTAGATITLPANGGTVVIPIFLSAPMKFTGVSLRQSATTLARTWGWDLYYDVVNNGTALDRIASSSANQTFTATAASTQTITASGGPIILPPGTYYLAIQCRHATNNFTIFALTAASSGLAPAMYKTKTLTNPNGSTLDIVAATWTTVTNTPIVTMNGQGMGADW